MTIKRLILRLFFTGEVLVFSWIYLYGTHGLTHLLALQKENRALLQTLTDQQEEIKAIEEAIIAWNADDFLKEKIAREKLQMARRDEEVYYLTR